MGYITNHFCSVSLVLLAIIRVALLKDPPSRRPASTVEAGAVLGPVEDLERTIVLRISADTSNSGAAERLRGFFHGHHLWSDGSGSLWFGYWVYPQWGSGSSVHCESRRTHLPLHFELVHCLRTLAFPCGEGSLRK